MIFPEGHIFPTRKDENWKYTSLKSWLDKPYVLSDSKAKSLSINSEINFKAVFVNGCFKEDKSNLPKEVQILFAQTDLSQIEGSLNVLNSKFTKSTTIVRLAPHSQIKLPLQLVFLTSSEPSPSMNFPQVRLEMGEFSKMAVAISHETSDNESISFVSSWFTAQVGTGAQLECVVLQNQNIQSFHYEKAIFKLEAKAQVKILEVALGSLLSRSEIEMEIRGSEVSAQLLGVYVLNQKQQSDHYTSIRHLVGGSETQQIYKGLLDGQSKGVFNGHVFIAPDAQKANSDQINKNLLLSEEAEINSKPELEIYADDVKATHGSTIGQIQKEEVFYLQTRGIKKEKAIQLVSEAFIMDVVERIENQDLKKFIKTALKVKGALK
jgi:Fe-S cluster assembly protein SufD